MTQVSRFWNGVAVGDALTEAPYDAPTEFAKVMMAVSGADNDPNKGGVWTNDLSELAATNPASTTVRIASGRAQVWGTWYENDANVDETPAAPAASTRIDRYVLRKDWAAQTVRIFRIAGVEGGGAPALVQSIGTTWDYPIVQASTTTGGVVTLTDQRTYLLAAGAVLGANTFTGIQRWAKGADIASAATVAPGTDGNYFDITGAVTITTITPPVSGLFMFQFDGALKVTHGTGAGNPILAGDKDFYSQAGSHLLLWSDGVNCWEIAREHGGVTSAYAAAAADVTLNNTANYFDVASVSLTAGYWYVSAKGTGQDTSAAANFSARIYDGATVHDSNYGSASSNSNFADLACGAIVALTATTTVKLQMRDHSTTAGIARYNQSGAANDCSITAIRIG